MVEQSFAQNSLPDHFTNQVIRITHNLATHALAFSPDGRLLASGKSNEIQLWDVGTGTQANGVSLGSSYVTCVGFSPDGSLLALVGPRRVPTRLYLDVPEFGRGAIDFIWPVIGPVVSSVGRRRSGWHAGIDIRAEAGTPVYAAAPGTVQFSGWARAYGHVVMLEHSNDFVTIYAHNLENLVKVGDAIDAGTVIASVGRSARLHPSESRRRATRPEPPSMVSRRSSTRRSSYESILARCGCSSTMYVPQPRRVRSAGLVNGTPDE